MTFKLKDKIMTEEETSFRIDVKFPKDFDDDEKPGVLADIGEFVKTAILESVGKGETPIEDGKWVKKLTKDYRRRKGEESGVDYSNMELFGDMLDDFDYEIDTDDSIKIGIFDPDQAVKSFAHNTGYKGHPVIPQGKYTRQFLPRGNKNLKSAIMKGIDQIIDEAVDASKNEN